MVIDTPLTPSIPTEPSVEAFKRSLHGQLLTPNSVEFDDVRKIFNAMIDRRPALIARCIDTHDVVESVRFARDTNMIVSVRGGGHSVAGHCVCDDGLMIDLSLMKQVEIDPVRQIARAQPGLRLGEFLTEIEKEGFVSPTGTVSDTGLAGLTLGGGYGWLSGKYGMAVDNLLGAEVVTADGQVVRASDTENPDLFWALRGGSGNFGIVTSFELKLYPLDQVLGGLLIHPFERAVEVLRYYRDVARTAPDELTTYAAFVTGPDGHKAVGIALCYCGPLDEGERVIAPIRAFGPPVADLIRPMKYSEINMMLDAANPSGMQNYWKWNGLREISDEAIDIIVEHFARVPSPRSVILIDQLHGAAQRVDPTATAFAHRDAPHGLVIISMWEDPAESDPNVEWARSLSAATAPWTTGGVYVNANSDARPQAAFGVNHDRLAAIKRIYDPTNLFRHNQNITPASNGA